LACRPGDGQRSGVERARSAGIKACAVGRILGRHRTGQIDNLASDGVLAKNILREHFAETIFRLLRKQRKVP
jgi:hypothetical protein